MLLLFEVFRSGNIFDKVVFFLGEKQFTVNIEIFVWDEFLWASNTHENQTNKNLYTQRIRHSNLWWATLTHKSLSPQKYNSRKYCDHKNFYVYGMLVSDKCSLWYNTQVTFDVSLG